MPLLLYYILTSLNVLLCIKKDDFSLSPYLCLHRFLTLFACPMILSGVPQALISVNAIDYLSDLFSSSNDTTIGIASVALGYLSFVPEGQRKLLHRYI